jgi:hypothetical protein
MVMMCSPTSTVEGFAAVSADHVDFIDIGHRLQRSIHRRKPDLLPLGHQRIVDLLGTNK